MSNVPFEYASATHKYTFTKDCMKREYRIAYLRELLWDIDNGIYTKEEAKRLAEQDKTITQMAKLRDFQIIWIIIAILGFMCFIK